MLNTLKELCLLNGVSGDEDEVRRYITAKAVKHARSEEHTSELQSP